MSFYSSSDLRTKEELRGRMKQKEGERIGVFEMESCEDEVNRIYKIPEGVN